MGIFDPVGPPEPGEPEQPLTDRLAWFVGLWLAGLVVIAIVAYGLRGLIL